jgi:hypothetical protein
MSKLDYEDVLREYDELRVVITEHIRRRYEVKVNLRGDSYLSGYQILLVKKESAFEDVKKVLFAESSETWGYSVEIAEKLFNKQVTSAQEFANELNGE